MAPPHICASIFSRYVMWTCPHHRAVSSSWSLTWLCPINVLLHSADPWNGSTPPPCCFIQPMRDLTPPYWSIQLILDLAPPYRRATSSSWSLTWLCPIAVLLHPADPWYGCSPPTRCSIQLILDMAPPHHCAIYPADPELGSVHNCTSPPAQVFSPSTADSWYDSAHTGTTHSADPWYSSTQFV